MSTFKVSDVTDLEALSAVEECRKKSGTISGNIWSYMRDEIPFKVKIGKMERLVKRKLVDFGTSLNYPWLTPEGVLELERLRKA